MVNYFLTINIQHDFINNIIIYYYVYKTLYKEYKYVKL
jgi:hypothetical protein